MITLTEWMAAGRDADICLSAAGASPLTYAGLRQLSHYVQQSLNAVGVGRNDRVALVLPNSAEMAASFVTVAACCTSAPLNPAYRADEFEFYLNDLHAKALVVEAGSKSPAIEVARKLGVSILVLHPTPALGAGSFTLDTSAREAASPAHPRPGITGGRGVGVAHIRHHIAAKDSSIDTAQCVRVCEKHCCKYALHIDRPWLECHAFVPYPRFDRWHIGPAVSRRRSALHRRL